MTFQLFKFDQLSPIQTWMIFKLRQEIFVLEQACLFPEIDDKDPLAWHLIGWEGTDWTAQSMNSYCRILAPGVRFPQPCISRVVVALQYRGTGLGHQMMLKAIEETHHLFGNQKISLSAQQHLVPFYQRSGFQSVRTPYLEDDIWHQDMELPIS